MGAGVRARGQPSETPLSQRPLRGGWDDSPMSATVEGSRSPGRYFSPYSSQFSSPVSAAEQQGHMPWPDMAPGREIGLALAESPGPDPPEPAKGEGRAWDGVDVYGGGGIKGERGVGYAGASGVREDEREPAEEVYAHGGRRAQRERDIGVPRRGRGATSEFCF